MAANPDVPADAVFNIASTLPAAARDAPNRVAIILAGASPGHRPIGADRLTFRELELQSNRAANGFVNAGINRQMRTLVMVKPGIDFITVMFALFKIGAVPVLIDPGMGVARLLECVRQVKPEAFIGIPLAHAARVFRSSYFKNLRVKITVGRRWFWGGTTLASILNRASSTFAPAPTRRDEAAAILFTSGSTGPAKGVIYQHGMFGAQVELIRSHYNIQPGEIDLPTFPLFALFNPALGTTSVIPDMNPSRPGRVNQANIVDAVRRFEVSSAFGSPALWNRVALYCIERDIMLKTIRRVLIAGAPVPWQLIERMKQILTDGAEVHTPYGATEALPVCSISGSELLAECVERSRQGAGNCVGKAVPGIDVAVIGVKEKAISRWSDSLCVPLGTVGEIVVRGPVVTREYAELPDATVKAKIRDGLGVWHRMGDVGYFDSQGRLWFCGRKAHRVQTRMGVLWSIPCESIFNQHPAVGRSALVGVGPSGREMPVIIIEPRSGKIPLTSRRIALVNDLLMLAVRYDHTRMIRHVLFHRSFPVDVRHNAKINREALSLWAARRFL